MKTDPSYLTRVHSAAHPIMAKLPQCKYIGTRLENSQADPAMLVLPVCSLLSDTGSAQQSAKGITESGFSQTDVCSGDCCLSSAASIPAGLLSGDPVLGSANLACTWLLDAWGCVLQAMVVLVFRGDNFSGDILGPSVRDRPRSASGDAGSDREGDDHAEIRSALLGEDCGVSRSCAILWRRFWIPARSVCNLLSRLSSVPGKPDCK